MKDSFKNSKAYREIIEKSRKDTEKRTEDTFAAHNVAIHVRANGSEAFKDFLHNQRQLPEHLRLFNCPLTYKAFVLGFAYRDDQ